MWWRPGWESKSKNPFRTALHTSNADCCYGSATPATRSKKWSEMLDLNQRHVTLQDTALPTALFHQMEHPTRIELVCRPWKGLILPLNYGCT